jgi:hypothetical protein
MTETKQDPPTPAEMIEIFARHMQRNSLCATKEDYEEILWLIRNYCDKIERDLEEEE